MKLGRIRRNKQMRLIDKDFILETAKDKEWGLWCEIVNIKFAPEVDAIPVEWIKKYYTDITSPYTDTRIQFEEMIRKWEKENEAD